MVQPPTFNRFNHIIPLVLLGVKRSFTFFCSNLGQRNTLAAFYPLGQNVLIFSTGNTGVDRGLKAGLKA